MVDHISKEKRSWNMSRIRSKNTKPELLLRSLLHKAGFRFRLTGKISKKIHPKGSLPDKPDIVLSKYRTVIFVHGCFWHRHKGCKGATFPKTKVEFWKEKFVKNVDRDKKNASELKRLGWKVIIIWECELKDPDRVLKRISNKLAPIYIQTSPDYSTAADKKAEY